MIQRKHTRPVSVRGLQIGGGARISIQTMTKCPTWQVDQIIEDCAVWREKGLDIVRIAVPDKRSLEALGEIRKRLDMPLVADIHFDYTYALEAIRLGVDKIRINPGNMRSKDEVRQVVEAAKAAGIPIRIGVNTGSIQERKGLNLKEGAESISAQMLAAHALEYVKWFEEWDYRDMVISAKSTDPVETVETYRILSRSCDYPLHLGVTEAGPWQTAVVKSAVGLGSLLMDGIGDTIRVSITANSEKEIEVGKQILESIGAIERTGPQIVSCPSCGRCEVDLEKAVQELQEGLKGVKKNINVAVLGCVVNGPGEAANADIGLALSRGYGYIFKGGKQIRTLTDGNMVGQLLEEIEKL